MKISIQSILLFVYCIGVAKADDTEDGITIEIEDDSSDTEYQYKSPQPVDQSAVYFSEHFDDPVKFDQKWVRSEAKKMGLTDETAKYDGVWSVEPAIKDALKGDLGLALKSKAKHAAISAPLLRPFVFDTKPLIVQYEVLLQDGQECGGAYIKLLNDKAGDLKNFHDKSPYSIMFGPDKCGNDHKLHFIFRHKNPKNGSIEEKHCQKPKERLEEIFADKLPHLYTLLLQPDNTFEVQIDQKRVNWGSLLEDFTPAVNPPAEIEDPTDKKPEDWDEREKIPDPNAVKPEDWDEDAPAQIVDESAVMPSGWLENEPTHLPDPKAQKPADWDNDMDGEWEPPLVENPACVDAAGCGTWEPPLINNPAFKGKWRPPMIDNPNYRGKWRPRKIPNPDFFEDNQPFRMHSVQAVGFELWSMSKDILFDNIIITDDYLEAEQWAKATFEKKRQKIARDSESVVQKLANLTNDYPLLWAVYIIVLSIPVVFILYLCCKPSASQTQEQAELKREAEKKKTDEPTEENVETKEEPQITEVDGEKAEEEVDEGGEEEDDEDAEKISNPDTDDEQPIAGDDQAAPVGEGTRKRKVRKD